MRRARVFVNDAPAGILEETLRGKQFAFWYDRGYDGDPVSLTMPVEGAEFLFEEFPSFFDGVLPEGVLLDALIRQAKVDRDDLFGQLVVVGKDLVGNVTVEEML